MIILTLNLKVAVPETDKYYTVHVVEITKWYMCVVNTCTQHAIFVVQHIILYVYKHLNNLPVSQKDMFLKTCCPNI